MKMLAAGTIVAMLAVSTRGEDWPNWRGPRGDGISKETKIANTWPAGGPKQLWTAKVGIGFSTPLAVDGKIYMFALTGPADATEWKTDTLYCLDAASGKELWKQSYDFAFKGPYTNEMMGGWRGTRASPVVEAGKIYTHGPAGDLVCRELADGKEIWHTNILVQTGATPVTWGQSSNPLIDGDLIYVQSGQGGPVCVAVDKKTGKINWQSDKGLGGYAQPIQADVAGTKQIIVFGGDAIWGLDAKSGTKIWTVPWKNEYFVNAATPIFHDGKLFVTAAYTGGHCAMFSLSGAGAKELWKNNEMTCRFQPPILDNGAIYGNSEGTVKCLNWNDGKAKWSYREKIGPGGSLLRVGDKLILLSERGKLILTKATPDAVEKLSEFKALDGTQIWSAPMIYNGKLYVKGTEDLICLDVAGK